MQAAHRRGAGIQESCLLEFINYKGLLEEIEVMYHFNRAPHAGPVFEAVAFAAGRVNAGQ